MIRDLFWQHWWPGVLLGAALHVSDYACTLATVRAYRAKAGTILVYEGSLELNPVFEKDIDSGRVFSPRFLVALMGVSLMIAWIWWLTHQTPEWPALYAFALGAFVLLEMAIHTRHLRNLHMFRTGFGSDGIRGKAYYPRPLMLRLSAVGFLGSAAVYLVIYLATGSRFVLGGMVACLFIALKHRLLARRAMQQAAAGARAWPP